MHAKEVFGEWARTGRANGMESRHGPTARIGFDWLAVGPGERYLDIGCGNGYTVRWAAQVDPTIAARGIDAAADMIELARRMSGDLANASFDCDEFPSAILDGQTFDAIFSMEALYYLPDVDAALASIRGLLAPGGRFANVVDFFAENEASHSWPDDLGVPMTLLSAAQWRAAFEGAGFEVADQHRAGDSLITCLRLPPPGT